MKISIILNYKQNLTRFWHQISVSFNRGLQSSHLIFSWMELNIISDDKLAIIACATSSGLWVSERIIYFIKASCVDQLPGIASLLLQECCDLWS